MILFLNREMKMLFVIITAILLAFLILGQAVADLIAADYKQNLIKHDYEVAGYLYRHGLERSQITYAFTSEKTKNDLVTGQQLLQTAGYMAEISNDLLPEVERLHQKYAALMFVLSGVLLITILATVLFFALRQDKKIQKASADIWHFMKGNVDIRLDDRGEGSLSKLFASINEMATSLNAYIVKEKQGKEFLRDAISDISHQLKTPLAAIRMYNEIIQNENTGNDVVHSFTLKSERELTRIETLIKNLLKLARLDAGSIELEKRTYKLKEFLEDAIKRFRIRTDLEGKLINLDCNDHITLNFDREWLLEAVSNIIKNALDHTNSGDRIDILCLETPVVTEITVKDNGIGIHPEDIHHIFKRFYRSRFSKDKEGVGIGLTLSKTIIEKHGGSVTVESELGKTTSFHLLFPKLTNM